MTRALALLLILAAGAADAQQCLYFADEASAHARSAAQYRALCKAPCTVRADGTQEWWNVYQAEDGRWCVEVQPSGPYSTDTTLATGTRSALTPIEQSRLAAPQRTKDRALTPVEGQLR